MHRSVWSAVLLVGWGCTGPNPAFDEGDTERGTVQSTGQGEGTASWSTSSTGSHATDGSASETGTGIVSGSSSDGAESTGGTGSDACVPRHCDGVCIEQTCKPVKRVFLSSESYVGAFGGLEMADEACNTLARQAGLPGTFRAWLSDETGSPATRMTHSPDPYVRVDGKVVAEGWADLTDGDLLAPISIDEYGNPGDSVLVCVGQETWSNTAPDGTAATDRSCENWTLDGAQATSEVGFWDASDASWTHAPMLCGLVSCGSALPIYCFEQ